ncbi:hypothetical protein GCM10017744_000780 [Streptomyces antimycoticus]|uniref:Uncharacterized protein n=1 Tax=Streptomyces antimycoticus TaxID=68175 RepID=A0A4D4KQ28_9ACTN|nr:hypothetical protein SANT12839_098880 [Streptomyces antimycoticus]
MPPSLLCPEFGLPVVGEHFKHVGEGGTDQWTYQTYAPLDLRPDDTFNRFITGRSLFWAQTEKGLLPILPQRNALGYNLGGPHALAAYLTQVADSDGRTRPLAPRMSRRTPRSSPGPRAARPTAARTN